MLIKKQPKSNWKFLAMFLFVFLFLALGLAYLYRQKGQADDHLFRAANCSGNWLQTNLINQLVISSTTDSIFARNAIFSGQDKQLLCGGFVSDPAVMDFTSAPTAYLDLDWQLVPAIQPLSTSTSGVVIDQVIEQVGLQNSSSTLEQSSTTTTNTITDFNPVSSTTEPVLSSNASTTDTEIQTAATSTATDSNLLMSTTSATLGETTLLATTTSTSTELVATNTETPTFVDDGSGQATNSAQTQEVTSAGFRLRYTINGADWFDLAFVPFDGLQSRLALPADALLHLDTLSISIESMGQLDSQKVVTLSSLGVNLNYQTSISDDNDPNPRPDFSKDEKIATTRNADYELVLIRRQRHSEDQISYGVWYRSLHPESLGQAEWRYVANSAMVNINVPPSVSGANILWSDNDSTLYRFNIDTQSTEAQSITAEGDKVPMQFEQAESGSVEAVVNDTTQTIEIKNDHE